MTGRTGVGSYRRTGAVLLGATLRLCACTLLLGGCAYYNGMYNTKRYARSAERSERAGRTSEAAERWRQVVLHADTLLARHPGSRWADDAELLKGRALVALGAWPLAVRALESAKGRVGTEEQLREAQYWLGIASAGRRDYATALANFDSALASARRDRRQAARLARGRMLLAMGRPAEALQDLDLVALDVAWFDRAAATLALEQVGAAAALADSAVGVRGVTPERWAGFLDTLGHRGGTREASGLVDRLVVSGELPSAARARLLLADGDRLASAGLDSLALARWAAVERETRDGEEGRVAAVRRLRWALRAPDASERMAEVRARLFTIAAAGGEAGREAGEILQVLAAVDSASLGDAAPDARAFQGAEWLRDSLAARPLAAEAFVRMASQWPASPWAPKAVLAAIGAGHPAADSLRRVLQEHYSESPYVLAAAGLPTDPEVYAAMEDSLAEVLEVAAASEAREGAAVIGPDEDGELESARRGRSPGRPSTAARPAPAPVRAAPARAPSLPRNPEP